MAIAVLERDRMWARASWRPHCAASLTGIRVAPFTAQNMSNNSCVTKDEKECRLSIFMMGEKPARVSGLPCQENRASLADRVRHRKGREALTIERRYSFPAGSTMSSSRWDKRSLNPERVPRLEVSVAWVSTLRHIQIIVEAGTSHKAFCEIPTQLAKHIGTGARLLTVRAVTTQSAYRPT